MTAPMIVGLAVAVLFIGSFAAGLLRARHELRRKREGREPQRPDIRLDVEIYKRRRRFPRGGGGRAA